MSAGSLPADTGAPAFAVPEGVQRVAAVLRAQRHPHPPVMLDTAARTAQQAADALGVAVGQIAKSIIFRRVGDGAAVLVVTSGDRRVDEAKVAARVGPLERATAAFVKERTGFSIGGVSPVAHAAPCVTLIDAELFRFEAVWAAAGHPHAVFCLQPQQLVQLTGAPVADVTEPVPAAVVPSGGDGMDALDALVRERAIKTLAARAMNARATARNLPSPCVSVCRMDPATGWCEGCYRTLGEIRDWGLQDDTAKRQVWAAIAERLQMTHPALLG